MKSISLYSLMPLLFISCSSSIFIPGKYGSESHGLKLNKDSTFEYKFYQYHDYKYSTGKWNKQGRNKLILNSFYKTTLIPLTVSGYEYTNDNINRISVQFINQKKLTKNCECAIFINDTLSDIKRCDSMELIELNQAVKKINIQIRKSPLLITSFRFSLDPLVTNTYFTQKDYGNFIKFNCLINDTLFSYTTFDNKIVKFKKSGIYFYDNNTRRNILMPKLKG